MAYNFLLTPGRARVMKLLQSLIWGLPLSMLSNLGSAAFAITLDLNVLPTVDSTGQCPAQLIAYETIRPFSEGGYSRDGMIKLGDIATNIRVAGSNMFSTTWVGTLKPQYRNCEGTAIITTVDDEVFSGQSYLQVQMADGEATVVLDMTGISDPNGFTSTLLFGGMRDGNPRWTWGGTD
jgi:hypothetical protein